MKPRVLFGTIWPDVLNKSILRYESVKYRPLSEPDLIIVLKTLPDQLSALLYCQRNRTPKRTDSLKEIEKTNSIQMFSIVKDFISGAKQNISDLLNQLRALQKSLETELKNVDFFARRKRPFLNYR